MGAEGHDGLAFPARVVLAHEPAFVIGVLQVDPPMRQVRTDAESETIEPRVMQVLVALYRARSAIVTRDDLIEWCWHGRIVGDDAINRTLSRIRQLASGLGDGSFIVETIPRVGYRLLETRTDSDRGAGGQVTVAPRTFARRSLLAGATAASAVALVGATLVARSRSTPIPAEARQLYDRAEALASASSPSAGDLVIPYLQEAVRIAPDFGEAWGFLALAYRSEVQNSPSRAAELEPRIAEAVANARRLAPGNADADAAVLLREWHYGKWQRVEPVYRGLIKGHPSYPVGYHLLGHLLMDVGRWKESIEPLRRAHQLDPFAPVLSYKLSIALWSAGRISESEDEITAALRRWPRHSAIWQARIKLLALSGRADEALALLADRDSRPSEDVGQFASNMRLTATALFSGKVEDRLSALTMIRENTSVASAIYAAALDDLDLALDMLEGLYLHRGQWAASGDSGAEATHPLFQPHAKSLWKEARFGNLIRAIGLEAYWLANRTQPDFRRFG